MGSETCSVTGRRKLRPMIITMGGERQKHMEELFAQPALARDFEPPVFARGIPSRLLRSRLEFLRVAHTAGLVPDEEFEAIETAMKDKYYSEEHPEKLFDRLEGIPITEGRRGSQQDVKLHYSVELWQKAKGINRGRAVLGCTFAHLIAMKRFVEEDFDILLEDNVRAPLEGCADRIWDIIETSKQQRYRGEANCDESDSHSEHPGCHLRYFGWLGSIPNLRWIYDSHIPRTTVDDHVNRVPSQCRVFSFPTKQDIESDLERQEGIANNDTHNSQLCQKRGESCNEEEQAEENKVADRKPGGNAIWGSYGYWISRPAYERLMEVLRHDVGALLWKNKRARHYSIKPIDKVLPRQVMSLFGKSTVHIPSRPAFFRAPMLTSKIHTQWDPEFCKSTEFQLGQAGLSWSELWLTAEEREVVNHREQTGEWLTLMKLRDQ